MKKKWTAGRLPWAVVAVVAIAVVIAVGGVFGWTSSPQQPTSPPSAIEWKLAAVWEGTSPLGGPPHSSGIENMYIMKHGSGYDKNSKLSQYVGNPDYCIDVITAGGQNVDVPYEIALDFVVDYRGDANDAALAYANKENTKAGFQWTSGFSYNENSTGAMEYVFDNTNYGQTNGLVYVNAVFDNNGNGWVMPAGAFAGYWIGLWVWG